MARKDISKETAENPIHNQNEAYVEIACSGGKVPTYATEGSAGADMYAALDDTLMIYPNFRAKVPLKFRTSIPEGYAGLILPRSGLAEKHGLTVLNTPGLIDADYRGEWAVLIINHGNVPVPISPGDRIAQLVIIPYCHAKFNLVESLPETERGEGGFGHTGK